MKTTYNIINKKTKKALIQFTIYDEANEMLTKFEELTLELNQLEIKRGKVSKNDAKEYALEKVIL